MALCEAVSRPACVPGAATYRGGLGLALLLLVGTGLFNHRTAEGATYRWNLNANGNWNVAGNWTVVVGPAGLGYPNLAGDIAQFTNIITANRTVTIPNGVTISVASITFDDNNNYLIAAAGTGNLIFNNGAGNATVTITNANGNGVHTISARLTFTGAGANTYTGMTTVNSGTLALSKNAGVNALGGNLQIGDGAGVDTVL